MMKRGFKLPTVLVPTEYQQEIMTLSKAALADMAWDLASQCCESADDPQEVIARFRDNWAIVQSHRKL